MNVRLLQLVALVLLAASGPCFAQTGTGTVTFYSPGLSTKEALKVTVVPAGTTTFTGWLFDGDQILAHVQRDRIFTFHLAAGEHKFSAPYGSKGPVKTPLHFTIEPGGHYCFRLSAKYKSGSILVPLAFLHSQIEEVSCQQAQQEAGGYKRIDLKRVDPAVRSELDGSSGFPNEN